MNGNTDTRYTVWNALVDIVASPATALDAARDNVKWLWVPLLTVLAVPILVMVWYFHWVDFPWLVEETIRASTAGVDDPDTIAAIEQGTRGFMTPGMSVTFTIIAITVMTLLIYAIQSGYLHLVSKAFGHGDFRYGQWFAMSAWTAVVGVFVSLAMVVVMLTADGNQVDQAGLNPVSMQSLFIHAEPGSAWFNWGNGLNLASFWALALLTLGYHRWTGVGIVPSAVIACAPWVLMFGIWALIIA